MDKMKTLTQFYLYSHVLELKVHATFHLLVGFEVEAPIQLIEAVWKALPHPHHGSTKCHGRSPRALALFFCFEDVYRDHPQILHVSCGAAIRCCRTGPEKPDFFIILREKSILAPLEVVFVVVNMVSLYLIYSYYHLIPLLQDPKRPGDIYQVLINTTV